MAPRKKKAETTTTSGSVSAPQPQELVAGNVVPTVQQSSTVNKQRNVTMSEELPSYIEYDDDIATAEAPPPLPVGKYRGQIKEAIVKSSQRETLYADARFYISPDSYPADFTEGDPDGMILAYRRVSLENKPQARFQVRKFCEAIGAPMSKKIDLNDWVGLEGELDVVHESFEGITRAVIKSVNPV